MKKCKLCKKKVNGRSDKIFCSVACKSIYHRRLADVTNQATIKIDKILHRNRSILLEIIGKRQTQLKVSRLKLEKKNFHFKYHTHYNTNKVGKMYHYVYDFAWMEFSNDEILIIHVKS